MIVFVFQFYLYSFVLNIIYISYLIFIPYSNLLKLRITENESTFCMDFIQKSSYAFSLSLDFLNITV